jgi:hypothetical protein
MLKIFNQKGILNSRIAFLEKTAASYYIGKGFEEGELLGYSRFDRDKIERYQAAGWRFVYV